MKQGNQSRRTAILAVVALFVVALFVFPGARDALRAAARHAGFSTRPAPIRTGQKFPALSFSDLNGQAIQVGSAASGTTVYNVFATWCSPCRAETPELERVSEDLLKRGIRVIGIDQGEPSAAVSAFAAEFDIRYPLLVDRNHVTTQVLGARVIPETIVVRDGIVRSISVGPMTAQDFKRVVSQSDAT